MRYLILYKNEQLFACSKEGLIIIEENDSNFKVERLIPNTPHWKFFRNNCIGRWTLSRR